MKTRFSKERLSEQLWQRADTICSYYKFDKNNGTSQLWPRGCNEAMKVMIDRAVEYGRYHALKNLALEVKDGKIGR